MSFYNLPLIKGEVPQAEGDEPQRRRCGNVMRAMRKRCASRTFPLERVWVQIASRRIPARGSCTPGETTKWCPHQITIFSNKNPQNPFNNSPSFSHLLYFYFHNILY
jgi:hypothetical protein